MPKPPKQPQERKVLYPEPDCLICREAEGNALTVAQTIKYMGFVDAGAGDPLFTDLNGKGVWALNNLHNRPFDRGLADAWMMAVLKRQWKLTGETIIISKYGGVISGQHRFSGLYLAAQMLLGKDKDHWSAYWDHEPTMDVFIAVGVEESDDVVNVVDTGKPRSLSDAYYRSEIFDRHPPSERKELSRMLAVATKVVWVQSGMPEDHWTLKMTHPEAFDFYERHKRLRASVLHIHKADANKEITRWSRSAGTAAGLLYLMGSSESDPDPYLTADVRVEKKLDWSMWDRACEFWTAIGTKGSDSVKALRDYIQSLANEKTGDTATVFDRQAAIVKAWGVFAQGHKLKPSDVVLDRRRNEDQELVLAECPLCGGIDFGGKARIAAAKRGQEEDASQDPDPEELEERKGKVKPTPEEHKDRIIKDRQSRKAAGEDVGPKKTAPASNNGEIPGGKVPPAPPPSPTEPMTFEEELDAVRERHPGKLVLFKVGDAYVGYGSDATTLSRILKVGIKAVSGFQRAEFPAKELTTQLNRLIQNGINVAVGQSPLASPPVPTAPPADPEDGKDEPEKPDAAPEPKSGTEPKGGKKTRDEKKTKGGKIPPAPEPKGKKPPKVTAK